MAGRRAASQHPMVRPMVRWKRYQWVVAIIVLGAIIVSNNAQQFNASSYGGLYGRTDDDKTFMAPKAGDCGGCSSPCTPKCVAEKGSRKWKIGIANLLNQQQQPDRFPSRPPHSQDPMNRPCF